MHKHAPLIKNTVNDFFYEILFSFIFRKKQQQQFFYQVDCNFNQFFPSMLYYIITWFEEMKVHSYAGNMNLNMIKCGKKYVKTQSFDFY